MMLQLPGGLAVVVGALLAAAGAARLAGAPTVPALGVGLATPIGLLVVGAVVAREANLPSPSAVVLACALGGAALLAAGVRWTEVVLRPLVLAGAGAALTVAVLLARGPGDWDMHTSHTLRLYGLPLVALGVALSVAILVLTDRAATAIILPLSASGACITIPSRSTPMLRSWRYAIGCNTCERWGRY